DEGRAWAELSAAHPLRPILTWGFPTISVQTRLELARVQVGLSDVPGARTLLAEVDEILTHRPDLGTLTSQAVELRRHVGSVRSGRSPGPTTLTAAELRLLSFLPTHLSFREIGARPFVSPNTVKTQAISIYRKLGVSARSDAVQAARDLRLLQPETLGDATQLSSGRDDARACRLGVESEADLGGDGGHGQARGR